MSYNPSGPAYTPGSSGPPYTAPGTAGPALSQAGFQDIINSWINSLTKPSIQTYAAEVPRTSQNRILLSAGTAIVVSAILGLIGGLLSGNLIGSFLYTLVTTAINFAVAIGANYAGAKIMKGEATLEQHAWVQSTYWAPIQILSSIPLIGWILGFIGALYSLYLTYLMMQGVHRLNSSNAIIAMIIGFVIALVIGLVVAAILGALFLGAALTSGLLGR